LYPWSNWRIILLFCFFGVLIIAFVGIQIWKQDLATVPPRVFMNRNVWGSAVFGAFLGASFFVLVYYLPIWFQAIKGASAMKSGIMNLPMILSLVIMSLIAGGLVTYTGYYTPFMYGSSVMQAIGAGLLTTFTTSTGHSKWIGYQVIYGIGIGMGMQQTLMAVQTALPLSDVPIGTATIMFAQTLGGALFISVAQNVFNNQLVRNLHSVVPDLSTQLVLNTGATELKFQVPRQFIDGVLTAYNSALTQTWYVSVAMSALSIFGALAIEWKSMKGKPAPAATPV
jgi:hypothetical protein